MRNLRYLNAMLTILVVLLALQLWTTWTASPSVATAAFAQGIPDEGAQRAQIIDQLKLLNEKTDQIKALLVTGEVRVTVTNPDSKSREDDQNR
jgi:Spy/CpxP family protein refolding chaperone